jgi:hypothetical protein
MTTTAQPTRPPGDRRRQLAGLLLAGLLATGTVTTSTGPAGAAPAVSSDPPSSAPGGHNAALVRDLRGDLESYLAARGEPEHLSAAGLSVSVPGRGSSIDLSAGPPGSVVPNPCPPTVSGRSAATPRHSRPC